MTENFESSAQAQSEPPSEDTTRTRRTIPAAPETVFGAFADSKLLAKWWGPSGFTNTIQDFDFSVGGLWRFTMHGPDGGNYWNENKFVELAEASRIVIEHVNEPHFFLTIELQPHADGTELHWAQKFDSPEILRNVAHVVVPANEQNLDRLTQCLREHNSLNA